MPSNVFQLFLCVFLPVMLALAGLALRALTWRGCIAAAIVGIVIATCTPALFPALVVMVAAGVVATEFRVIKDEQRKNRLEMVKTQVWNFCRSNRIIRGAGSVLGNGGASVVFAILFDLSGTTTLLSGPADAAIALDILYFAVAGSIAAAAADTVAGEIGRALRARAFSIVTFKPVEIGANGGVSVLGTFAGAVASAIIGTICGIFSAYILFGSVAHFSMPFVAIVTIAGVFGCFIDSFIGATVEGKAMRIMSVKGKAITFTIGNNETNFIGTFAGGLAGIIMRYFV